MPSLSDVELSDKHVVNSAASDDQECSRPVELDVQARLFSSI